MPIRVVSQPHDIGVGEDLARTTPTGLIEAAAGQAGMVGDLRSLGDSVANWVAGKFSKPGSPQPRLPHPAGPMPMEALRLATSKAMQTAGVDPRFARLATMFMSPGGVGDAPTSREVQGAMTGDRKLYQPQTVPGQYWKTGLNFAPAAVMPGTLPQRVARVAVPAAASETAGQVTKGTKLEPYARLAAALVGGLGVEAATRPGPQASLLARSSRGATDAQVAQARQLMEDAQSHGVRLTMAEALQQVTNGATSMGRMQRVVEGTEAGGAVLKPVMAQRPAQARRAVTRYADTIAPQATAPSMQGAAAQNAADTVLNNVRRTINFFAEPNYEALVGQHMDPAEYARLAQNPSYAHALEELRNHPELSVGLTPRGGPGLNTLPDNNMAVINAVVKRLNTGAEQVRPGPMNPMGDNELSALRGTAAETASEAAAAASPEFSAARQGVATGRQTFLEPLQRGPLGRVAAADDVGAQTSALFPPKPPEGMAGETGQALTLLSQQDPQAAAALVRQHLVTSANESMQDLRGGPNQWGGANWVATQTGNPEQAATLRAGIDAVGGDAGDFDRMARVLAATGRREGAGSETAFNTRALEEMGNPGVAGEVLRTGLNAPGVFRRMGQAFQDWQTSRNAEDLANAILANPAEAEAILMHARQVVPPNAGLQAVERAALTAVLARQQQVDAPGAR